MEGSKKKRVLEILAGNHLLSGLRESSLEELCSLGQIERFARNAVIFNKGDPGDRLYIVLSGQVGINTISLDGKEFILTIFDPGDLFGEVAVLDGKERTAGAVAMRSSELLRLRRADFLTFLESNPKLSVRLLAVLCERLRRTTDTIEDTVFLDIPKRLAKLLLSLMQRHGTPVEAGVRINVKLSQEDLGHMLGATRESVNKGMRTFRRIGAIVSDGGYLIIRDVSVLEDIVER